MKTPVEVLLIVGVLFVQGCVGVAYVPGVEKTDLSAVYEETATRSEIEAVLGEPVASRTTDEGSVSLYPYNRGAEGGFADQQDISDHPVGLFFMLTTLGLLSPGVTPFLYEDKVDRQKGFIAVFYSTDDEPTDIHLVGSGDPDAQMDRLVAGLELKRRAEDGDVEAMYEFGLMTDMEARWVWHCPAAHQGHSKAQYSMADYYRFGWGEIEKNIIESYVWRTLSLEGGGPRSAKARDRTEREMSADQIAEAESLLAKWKPNPADCEREAKLAADPRPAPASCAPQCR